MKTYLSLVHHLQPEENNLTAKGMKQNMAKVYGTVGEKGKQDVERAMNVLQLGSPMTETELQQKVPSLIVSLSQGRAGGRNP